MQCALQKLPEMQNTDFAPQDPTYEDYFMAPSDSRAAPVGRVRPYDGSDHGTWTLPKAYEGKNRSISRFISNTVEANDSFWTRDLLPIQRSDGLTVQWDETTYAAQPVSEVPELGVSRVLEADTEGGRETLVRRGLGIMMEKGMMESQQGFIDYAEKLTALQTSIALTNDLDALRSIVNVGYNNELRRRDIVTADLTGHLLRKADTFNALKKSANGFEDLVGMMDMHAKDIGEPFDRIVMPAETGVYLAQGNADRTDYMKRGQLGVDKLMTGVTSYDTFRDKRVYYQYGRDRTRGRGGSDRFNFEPLKCFSQVGEFYDVESSHCDPEDFKSAVNDIALYDETRDKFVRITAAEMINNCHRFDEEGNVIYKPAGAYGPCTIDYFQSPEGKTATVPARVFGHIRPDYFKPSDVKKLAKTAIKALCLTEEEKTAWSRGIDLVRAMEAYTVSDNTALTAYITAFGLASEKTETVNGITRCAVEADTGCLKVPASGSGLPYPIFFHSWAGIQAMAKVVEFGTLDKTWKHAEAHFQTAHQFAKVFRKIAAKLVEMFPTSYACDPQYALPVWKSPSAATVIFENLITPNSRPIGYNKDGPVWTPLVASPDQVNAINGINGTLKIHTDILGNALLNPQRLMPLTCLTNTAIKQAAVTDFKDLPNNITRDMTAQAPGHIKADIELQTFNDNYKAVITGTTLDTVCAGVYLLTQINKKAALHLVEHDVALPFKFIIARPHATYETLTVIFCPGNGRMGNTYTKEGAFTIGEDPVTQSVACNYTYYHKAVVKQQRGVFLATNAFCCKYNGGLGTQFIDLESYKSNGGRAIDGGSMMVFLVPTTEQVNDQFSLTGAYQLPEYGITPTTSVPENDRLHWTQSPFYNRLWQFNTERPSTRPAIEPQERFNINNTVVYRGHYLRYDAATKCCDKSVPGCSPLGPVQYVGVREVRNASNKTYRPDSRIGF